ncbi:MAG: small subunit ribosomal protein [Solirubrobacteraceae bacterium]|jgi:small subunit ribosomal protein S17|nr:small subunit ribosomal protein [Solirubrobacteraceae bacterium]
MPDQQTIDKNVAEREERRRKNREARTRRRAKEKAKRTPGTGTAETPPAKEHGPGRPRTRQGLVTSSKADKTITVSIESARRHKMYKKIIRSSTSLHAHDEKNEANEGDRVRVVECRPLSRSKRWRLVEILERAR